MSNTNCTIEFKPDGTILTADDNFLGALGYSLEEIKGQHHRMFCDPEYTKTDEYKKFWENLAKGEFSVGEYKRFTKNGDAIWIHAIYNPVKDEKGKVVKVVKFAADNTANKESALDNEGKVSAISRT